MIRLFPLLVIGAAYNTGMTIYNLADQRPAMAAISAASAAGSAVGAYALWTTR